MHDAMPALVRDSKALSRTVMNETPTNQANSADKAGAASSTSDEQLVLAFSRGSSHAFKELFSRYKQPIFGFFRRRVAESTQAEELTQETFVALLRAATRYEPRALLRAYLCAINPYFVVTDRVDGSSNEKKTKKKAPKEWRVLALFCGIL